MSRKYTIKSNLFLQSEAVITYFNRINNYIRLLLSNFISNALRKWGIPYIIMALLLGRATILGEMSPFAVPFFAVMYHLRRDKLLFIFFALLIGSGLADTGQTTAIFFGLAIYFFLQKILDKKNKKDLSFSPFLVFFSMLIPNFTMHIYQQVNQLYPWTMTVLEAMLAFVLTLIFVQAMPIIVYKKEQVKLTQEEVIALTIVMASVMTGTLGWNIYNLSIENIFSRYFVLLFALTGGGPIGASIGVVTGLILSLSNPDAIYQISLLAFSGLLAGLLKQANKFGVAVGLLLGTTILSIYLGNQGEIWNSFSESGAAIIMFLLTPKSLFKEVAKFIPGTLEYHTQYQDYVAKMKNITSNKIEQFSNMFLQLATSFKDISKTSINDQSEQIDYFMGQVSEANCKTCWKRHKCWNDEFFQTYRLMTELMTIIETKDQLKKNDIPDEWINHCVKHNQVAYHLADIYDNYSDHLYWKNQLEESRLLVSHQLLGISNVMRDLSIEIKKEGKELGLEEHQIQQSLEKLGLSVRQVNILNLEPGNVQIEVIQPNCQDTEECSKVVAPLISDVVAENIVVKNRECRYGKEGLCKICLESAKTYEIDSGYAVAAKEGKWLSGDSFSTIEMGKGKYAIAISDGMGNGERAQKESKATLELLQQLLSSGIDETISIKTINSVLLLRSQEEIFSTIDLAIVDLFNGNTKFHKVGSTPSFIKRGNEIITISANNLPIGIIQDIDIDSIEMALFPEDLLIMMTDGVYDLPMYTNNKELLMKRLIQEIETDNPQEFADLLLEKVIRYGDGEINDDMTIVISKIEVYKPEWSVIKAPGLTRIDRERYVN